MASEEKSSPKIKNVTKMFSNRGNFENRLCKYIHRYCFQERIQGYDFCIRHILEDKSAPFKQCTFVQQPHKKRCTNAAPKTDKSERREALCPFHAKQSILKVKVPTVRKRITKGPKAFLRSLEHYCINPRHDSEYTKDIDLSEKYDLTPCETYCPPSLRPPNEVLDKNEKSGFRINSLHLDAFEDHRNWETDYDYLRHAGVLTAKEVLRIAQEKSEQLKSLYTDELKRTYYRLKELRREYLRNLKIEQRKNGNKPVPAPKSKMLRCLESYHSLHGVHKIMKRKAEEKRLGVTPQQPKCIFVENGKMCDQVAVVYTSYCLNHLVLDPNQCLFVPCGYGSTVKCDRPVLPIGDMNVCKLHSYAALLPESKEKGQSLSSTDSAPEQEHFQSMDDIASLGLDAITPGCLFGLDQFGEPGESTDTVLSEEQSDLLQIQPITLNPPADILSDSRKSDIEEEKSYK